MLASGIVASLDERREHSVAGVEASAEQLLGDGDALALVAEVLDDAEQVPSVDAWGEGAYAALGLEDGDALDDDVDGVARDGDAEVVFGVEEGEAPEGVVEESAHDRVLAGQCGQAGAILLLAALLEGGAGSIDLLGGDGLVVELDAGAATAIVAGSVVERTRPGLGDQREDLPGQLARLLPTEVEVGDRLLKESEAALHMSLVLRSKGRSADPQRDVSEGCVDLWGVVGGSVVEEHREGCLVRRRDAVESASVTAALSSSSRADIPTKPPL